MSLEHHVKRMLHTPSVTEQIRDYNIISAKHSKIPLTIDSSMPCTARTTLETNQSKHTPTHTPTFNSPLSGTTRVSRYQNGKNNLDFTEARDSEWQWHQLGHMQVCTLPQTDNHASTPPLSFLQAGWPSCRPTNSVKALKANLSRTKIEKKQRK